MFEHLDPFRRRMVRRRLLLAATAVSLTAAAACGLADADVRSLSIFVEAAPSDASVGSVVTVRSEAEGQSLLRTIIEYGDGFVDTFNTVGFEQTVNASHRYPFAGTMTIRATAVDVVHGEAFDEVTIQVGDTAGG